MRLDHNSNPLTNHSPSLGERNGFPSASRIPAPKPAIVIVTMTRARGSTERDELLRSLRALAKIGLPVYVGEGGSDREFVEAAARLPQVQVCRLSRHCRPTLVHQLRTAFTYAQAANPDFFLYTEPDKYNFFTRALPRFLAAALQEHGPAPGLVLAARTTRGFATFPKGQQIAEMFMNRLCSEAFGQVGDYTYGPMLISNRLLAHAPHIPENLGWGWRFFVMAIAHQLRMPITLCTVPSQCPRAHRNEDDSQARDYRLRQLQENVTGLANGWTSLLDQPLEINSQLVAAA